MTSCVIYSRNRSGFGTLTYRNGNKYKGKWKNGLQHGDGELIKKNGAIIKAKWNKGKVVRKP